MIKNFIIQQYSDYYVAEITTDRGDIVTDGDNRDALMHNIYEAMDLHFSERKDSDFPIGDFSVKLPQPIISFQLPSRSRHATHA